VAGATEKVAELAVGDANIGGINIPVYLPGYFAMRYLDLAQLIGCVHQIGS